MKLTKFSIKRPVTIFMFIITILMFGFVSLFKLNIDMLPSFNLPMLMVMTNYQGAGPEEIESLISQPLESVLLTTSNVENIQSVSSEGSSMVMIEFAENTDMDFASLEIREKVDMIKPMLPESASSPMIMKLNPSMMPIMNIGISMKDKDLSSLSSFTNATISPSLERVEGVAKIDSMGAVADEVKIVLNPDKLASFGINQNQLIATIRGENLNIPGGVIKEGDYDLLVRTSSTFKSVDDIKNIPILTTNNEVVHLGNVADVTVAPKEITSYSKINGKDALILAIQKESNANTVKVSQSVNKQIEKLQKEHPDLEITTIFDQAEFINLSLNAVKTNAIVGAILAVIVLLFFLKDLRTTLVMAISIPISIVATFVCMYFSNMTLNVISLGGMALGVGMLVDNSIVVIENISRLKKQGLSSIDASIQGTGEVASAITSSTLTTVSVFLPILFVEGIAATIFKEMALTVTFALICSLIVSFTLVPLLASRLISDSSYSKENKLVNKVKDIYSNVLHWALDNKKYVTLLLVLSLVFGGLSLTKTGFEFFPASDQGIVYIDVILPDGSNLEAVQTLGEEVLDKVDGIKEIETSSISVSDSSSTASISLVLKPKSGRKRSDVEVAKELRNKTKDIAGAKINVKSASSMMSMSTGSPVSITISGHEFETLDKISKDLVNIISKVDGAIDVKSNNERSASEIRVNINKEKAAKYGINTQMIAQLVSQNLKGTTISNFTVEGKTFDITVYNDQSINSTLSSLKNISVFSPTGQKIPISELVEFTRGEGYSSIERKNQSRTMTVGASVNDRSLGDVVSDIEKELKNYKLPDGYTITFGGEVEQMQESFATLGLALVLAIALVYMVMAAQFESLLNPFIIMFTVPLAFVGGILALFIFNISISMPAMIGFVILTGIIVNNGIVLVDLINTLKLNGKSTKDAILIAGPTRLQPILMTTLTTVLGLLPMALGIGEGAEMQLPLAVSVTGGLIFSTLLTLIVVPVVYLKLDEIKSKIYKNKSRRKRRSISKRK